MPWQKIVRHISDQRLIVQSRDGKEYPVETEYDRFGEGVYQQMMNHKSDHKTLWGWINFDGDDGPVLEDWKPSDTCPDKPPWEV